MSQNPYASPVPLESSVLNPMQPGPLRLASQGQRLANFVLDNIVIQTLSAIVGFVVGAAYAATMIARGGPLPTGEETTLRILGYAVGILLMLGYFVLTESVFQRTLGKLASGTMVVSADGGRPSFGQIVGRSFARLIPFEPFSFLGTPPVGWHDKLTGTRVISLK